MEVILRDDVEKLGRRGEIVQVAEGYGRNYLLPQGLALKVTQANRTLIARERKAWDVRLAQEGLDRACQAMLSSQYDIVVLDEINVALYFDLLTVENVLSVIDQKPDDVELVLTGRRVPDEILARADYITVMQEAKHPYQQGIVARKGIEF